MPAGLLQQNGPRGASLMQDGWELKRVLLPPRFFVPKNEKEEWLEQFILKAWEERVTGNASRGTDCKHEKKRDKT